MLYFVDVRFILYVRIHRIILGNIDFLEDRPTYEDFQFIPKNCTKFEWKKAHIGFKVQCCLCIIMCIIYVVVC